MKRKLLSLSFAALALFSVGARQASAQDMGIELGKIPPAAVVQTLDGKPLNLSRYVGKGPVVLEFWATWCPNCRELMPALLAAEKKYGAKVKFLAVAINVNQTQQQVKRFLAAHPLPHETVWDVNGSAAEAFDAPATSYIVVLDRKGKVVYTGLGGRQNLDAAIAKGL